MNYDLENNFLDIAISLIKGFESCDLNAYPDPCTGDKPITIGWGCTQKLNGSPWYLGETLTQEEADSLLIQQLKDDYLPVLEQIPCWQELTNNQKAALLSFAWNNGAHFYGSDRFNTITKLLNKRLFEPDYVQAVFVLYRNPGSSVEEGLRNRRIQEAQLFSTPDKDHNNSCIGPFSMNAVFLTLHQTFLKTEPQSAATLPPEKKVSLPKGCYFKVADFQPKGKHFRVILEAQKILFDHQGALSAIALPPGEWYIYGSPVAADPHVEVYPSATRAILPDAATASILPPPLATFKMKLPSSAEYALMVGTFDLAGLPKPRQFTCTSGQPGYQYQGSTALKGRGPLPSCAELGIDNYWILTEQLERFESKGIEGYAFHIIPDPVDIRRVQRGEFMVHNDTNRAVFPGSSGCIVFLFDNGWNIWLECMKEFRDRNIDKIPLKVIYG